MTQDGHIRVLLCDDHAVVREGLARLLESTDGIDVVGTAADGAEGVAAAIALHPDVVLMDLAMPNVDGVAATRRISSEAPDARVVVLTSFSDNARIHDALDAGARGYLLKDAEAAEVVRAIRAAARGEAPLHPLAARELLDRHRAGPQLTDRESEILALVAQGLPNKLIARRLAISERTVKGHLTRVFERIGVTDRTQAALWARDHRLG
jgi:DNA-binding NarL/FixJ family response regulator